MEFSKKLKEIRRNKNLTQEELARIINVSRSLVARWEYGDVYPSVINLELLAEKLNVNIDELIDSEEKMNVIKSQEKKLININGKLKLVIYTGITLFCVLVPILYFCNIYWTIAYDYSLGIKSEKIIYYSPISGIDNNFIWLFFVSLFLNISLLIILNIFTFIKKDFASRLLKVLLIVLVISVVVSILFFVLGTFNPPQLK